MTAPGQTLPANIAAEAALLGAMMIDNRIADDVADIITAEDFSEPLHGRIFAASMALIAMGKTANPVTLNGQFAQDPAILEIGGVGYLATLTSSSGGILAAREFAQQILDLARLRRTILALQDAVKLAYAAVETDRPLAEVAEAADAALNEALTGGEAELPGASIGKLFRETLEGIEAEKRGELPPGLTCATIPDLTDVIGGMRPGEVTVIAGRPGMGKAQPLDAKVLTASGWSEMGALAVGDELASVDGARSVVTGIFPQGEKQIFRVTMSDGRSTECCDEHLWTVHYRDWDEPKTLPTKRVREMLGCVRYKNRLWVDLFDGGYGRSSDLPIDPWLLGALLGDGYWGSGVKFSSDDPDILTRIKSIIGSENLIRRSGYDYYLRDGGDLHRNLKMLGLGGRKSFDKFVPPVYLNADRQTRLEILRGLMDTDGWVEKLGSVRFATASEQLANDVCTLVRSLGGLCSVKERTTFHTYKGERRKGRASYQCRIRFRDASRLFSLYRKVLGASGRSTVARLNFQSIEPVRVAEAQCISVSHPSHLYVTDDFIMTHNTALSLSIALGVAENGHGVGFISREMSREELGKRMLAERIFDHGNCPSFDDVKAGRLQAHDYRRLSEIQAWADTAAFEIIDRGGSKIGQIIMGLRRLKRRMAAKGKSLDLAVIDYLQLVEPDKKTESRVNDVGYVSRKVKQAAKDLGIHIILLAQLSRAVEQREDKHPVLSDLRDSGEIEQDADNVVFIYREEYYLKLTEPAKDKPGYEQWLSKLEASRNRMEIYSAKRRNGETARRHPWFFLANQAVRGSRYFEDRR